MIGVAPAVEALCTSLEERLPDKLSEIAARTPGAPIPVSPFAVQGWEPDSHALDQLPIVIVTELTSESIPVEKLDRGELYSTDIQLALFVFVAADSIGNVADLRRTYALAVVELLLERPGFADGMRVVSKRMRAEYSDVVRTEYDSSMIGGFRIRLTVRVEEMLGATAPVLHPAPQTIRFEVTT